MFTITPAGGHRLDIELSGRLDSDAMRTMLDELVRKSETIQHGRMLYRVHDFDWPTLGAIGVELSRLPDLFALLRRFDRIAVIADRAWLRGVGEIEGALIPGVSIKSFEPGEAPQAEAWLAH